MDSTVSTGVKKNPAEAGLFQASPGLLGADQLDVDTTVGLQALDDLLALRSSALARLRHRVL
ncbi:MAG: hypothetical protein KDI53_15835, partial [Candidatus Accumulibacter sp.]|nr:hypothetical protein [Accumulibacter sp.]